MSFLPPVFFVSILIEYDELKRLELNAVTDPLTGLHNRRLFAETFEKELNRARRYGQPLGLVTLDLHRFKEVNDKHGPSPVMMYCALLRLP